MVGHAALLAAALLSAAPAAACSRQGKQPPLHFDPDEYVFAGKVVDVVTVGPWSYRWFWGPRLFSGSSGAPWALRIEPDEVVHAPEPAKFYEVYVYAYTTSCITSPTRESSLHSLVGKRVRVAARPSEYVAGALWGDAVRLEVHKDGGFVVWESTGRFNPAGEPALDSAYDYRAGLKRLSDSADDDAREAAVFALARLPRFGLTDAEELRDYNPGLEGLGPILREAISDPARAKRISDTLLAPVRARARTLWAEHHKRPYPYP